MAGNADLTTAETRLLIDGKLIEAADGTRFDDVNPATEDVVARVADATPADMERAIAAARHAFDDTAWSTNRAFRRQCLVQLQEALEREKESLRGQVVAEAGAPIGLTYGPQLQSPIDDLVHDIEMIDRFEWERRSPAPSGMPFDRAVVREPFGVVGAITPWNFPFALNMWKLGPALAAGNTVVLKPAPDTPLSATMIAKLAVEQTDIPPGVLNVVTSSDRATLGEILTTDPRVDMVAFTGSVPVGKRVLACASNTVKKVVLELGGKSANIVLEDADVATAMATIGMMSCYHGGQGCVLAMRTLVVRERYDEAVEALRGAMANVAWGDPMDPANLMGPLASRAQYERVLGYIKKGKAEGGRVVLGGGPARDFDKGFFVEPTLFADVDPYATIAQEEIFGPVHSIIPVDDAEQAVRIANDTRYGLAGAVYSASTSRAVEVARRLRVGGVSINGIGVGGPDMPFGGYKESGLGREHGVEGFGEYLETKTMPIPHG